MKRLAAALFFLMALSLSADEATLRGKVSPQLLDAMSKTAGDVDVVVLLWGQEITNPSLGATPFERDPEAYAAESRRSVDALLEDIGRGSIRIRARYQSFAGFSARISSTDIHALAEHPSVRSIVPDVPATFHRVEGNALMKANSAVQTRANRGNGVTVVVIDDGVDYMHPELGGAAFPNSVVIGGYDFAASVEEPSPASADDSHGTSVAAIIAGRGDPTTGGTGVAPGAKLAGIRIGGLSHVLSGLDWATNKTRLNPPIGVVNMSLGFDPLGFFTSNCDSHVNAAPYKAAVDRLTAVGVAVVASTGNENYPDRTSIPSCLSGVISAGAVYDANLGGGLSFGGDRPCSDATTAADKVACYSNAASFVSVLAPSHFAKTAKAGGGYNVQFGGTSAAAPYTAGAVALLMSGAPGKTVAQYRDALRSTGTMILDPKAGISTPRIDVDRALAALQTTPTGPKGNIYFLPAIAKLSGQTAQFKSDVRIYNKGTSTASVDAYLLSGADNAAATAKAITIPPGQSVAFNDGLSSIFGAQTGGGGARFASDQPLVITSDLYATDSTLCPSRPELLGGTFGQFIPAYGTSEAGTLQRVYNVMNNAAFRTNLGVMNTTATPTAVTVTLKDGNGEVIGRSQPYNLGPYGWAQFNRIFDQLSARASGNAFAEVTASVAIIAYASVLDNKTNDPFFVGGRKE